VLGVTCMASTAGTDRVVERRRAVALAGQYCEVRPGFRTAAASYVPTLAMPAVRIDVADAGTRT
jgi:hypothetical protein